MSSENVELAKRINALFNSRQFEAMFECFSRDIVWRDLMHAPDAPEAVQGIDAVREIQRQWDAAFEDLVADVEEFIDAGDFVVMVSHWRAKGRSSDVDVDIRAAEVAEFEDGKLVRITLGYPDKDAALEAARRSSRPVEER